MAQCPRCKEDMPLLSKICPVCGYVEEGKEGEEGSMSITQFVQTLEARLSEIKYIPEPSFMKGMGHFTYIIYPILAVAFIIMAVISEAGIFWIAAALFVILSIVSLVKKSKGTLGYEPFNRWFKVVKNDFEYHERIAKQSYGKSPEVSKLISDISGQISTIEKHRSSALKRNTLIWSVIVVLLLGAAAIGVKSVDSTIKNIENAEQEAKTDLNTQMEIYRTMDDNTAGVEDARQSITRIMLTNETPADAEEFFVTECMGKMQDTKCAEDIVKYYIEKSNVEAANKFIERCNGLRYKSDVEKLKNLVTQNKTDK